MFETFDGFSLIRNGIAFRAMEKKDGEYVSPTNEEFIWGTEGIAIAKCNRMKPFEEGVTGNNRLWGAYEGKSWHPPEEIPHENCTCGLYAAFDVDEALPYEQEAAQAVLFLVEAHGRTRYYARCLRSAEQRVIAVVGENFSDVVASDYFKVPMVTLSFAKVLMDIQNTRVANKYSDYDYVPRYHDKALCDDTASRLPLLPDDPLETGDPSLMQAIEWPFK